MSVSNVRKVVRQFIQGESRKEERPGASLALRGAWGVGKTFFWKKNVIDAAEGDSLFRKHYAYVSLFGLKDLDSIKAAIIAGKRTSLDLAEHDSDVPTQRFWRKGKKVLSPYLSELIKALSKRPGVISASLANTLAFDLAVRDMLICFDDLERLGSGLPVKDVLGLMTQLREERNCDVALILNEDQLEGEAKSQFASHGEKAIDVHLSFDPTPEEAFGIVYGDWDTNPELVRTSCLTLDISNIRVLYRIKRNLEKVVLLLKDASDSIVNSAVKGTVLLTWARYDPEGAAPPFELVRTPNPHVYLGMKGETERTEDEERMVELYRRYEHTADNAVDRTIADFVERGWFNIDELEEAVAQAEKDLENAESIQRIVDAWALYHDSLDDNEEALVDAFYTVHKEEALHVTPQNMTAALTMLKDFERPDLADELIEVYVEVHKNNPAVLKYRDRPFRIDKLENQELADRLDVLANEIDDSRTLASVLDYISSTNGWSPNDTAFLADRSVEEYEQFFRSLHDGRSLDRAVRTCRRFGRFKNPEPEYNQIADRAVEALRQIARSSRINRMRMEKKYGILIDEPAIAPATGGKSKTQKSTGTDPPE